MDGTVVVISRLIVSRHSRRFVLLPDIPLSFLPRHSRPPKSHRIISFADHHPLTLLESYRSKNMWGGGRFLLTSLPPYFLTSKSESLIYVPKITHQSPVPIPDGPRTA